jgi:hypothetical protein
VQQFGIGQPAITRGAHREEIAQQVIVWLSAPPGRQFGEVREQFDRRGVDGRQHLQVVDLEDTGQVPRHWPESLPVCLRDPDQLADNGDRQQVGKVVHELDGRAVAAAISHGVEQPVSHPGDRGL